MGWVYLPVEGVSSCTEVIIVVLLDGIWGWGYAKELESEPGGELEGCELVK